MNPGSRRAAIDSNDRAPRFSSSCLCIVGAGLVFSKNLISMRSKNRAISTKPGSPERSKTSFHEPWYAGKLGLFVRDCLLAPTALKGGPDFRKSRLRIDKVASVGPGIVPVINGVAISIAPGSVLCTSGLLINSRLRLRAPFLCPRFE